jgi:hypothetical protein
LNSPPCRLRMSIVKADDKTFWLRYDTYSDPELCAEEIELPFYCLNSDRVAEFSDAVEVAFF